MNIISESTNAENQLETPDRKVPSRLLLGSVAGLRMRPRFSRAEGTTGVHSSPQKGETVEFQEYKPYTPGVVLKSIDWKLYARSDRLYVKSYCDERASRFHFILDDSMSMSFPKSGMTKLEYACQLIGAMAYIASERQKDVIKYSLLSEVNNSLTENNSSFSKIMRSLSAAETHEDVDIAQQLENIDLRTPTTVVFVSDMYIEAKNVLQIARGLRRRGHEFWGLHLLSKEEVSLPYEGSKTFVDMESGMKIAMEPAAVRSAYKRELQAHLSSVRKLADTGRYAFGVTGQEPVRLLTRFLSD